MQEIAWVHGKDVSAGEKREYGHATIQVARHPNQAAHMDKLLRGLKEELHIYMSHGDKLATLPASFTTIASTSNAPFAGIVHQSKAIYGIQWHPEVTHSDQGTDLLRNFAVEICGAHQNWTMDEFAGNEIARVRALVGKKGQVIGAVSGMFGHFPIRASIDSQFTGGVDSTVAAKIMKEAIGDRFHAVLVDNGLLRLEYALNIQALGLGGG